MPTATPFEFFGPFPWAAAPYLPGAGFDGLVVSLDNALDQYWNHYQYTLAVSFDIDSTDVGGDATNSLNYTFSSNWTGAANALGADDPADRFCNQFPANYSFENDGSQVLITHTDAGTADQNRTADFLDNQLRGSFGCLFVPPTYGTHDMGLLYKFDMRFDGWNGMSQAFKIQNEDFADDTLASPGHVDLHSFNITVPYGTIPAKLLVRDTENNAHGPMTVNSISATLSYSSWTY